MRMSADTAELSAALDDLSRRADQFGSAMTRALTGAVSGGKSLDQVMQGLVRRFSDIALNAALKPLETILSGVIGGPPVGGGGAAVTPFAKGGIVARPSFFSHGGGLGVMGEAGPEAILPLRRGPDGRLGVAAGGQGGGPSIVFNVTTPDAQSFRKSEMQINAMLARAAGRGRRGL
ncbi:phage tail tape measure protein [Fulvimarina sp. 2208YS6-2-32]|uniref:Phage tail tape measure protein n=1 Tax=Fulvimarina uroteuthidis TaxID=3098149 RepID=A0ABU5I4M7_9HYPH|nr:phage tail tape measure protein [Fulvimarina sp. 2208YS6-2-32]MDY8109116.1 phage tail tape measure protein [Fulvimarina sp. 2208YS6-2-32]